ncbi:hypothetical protein ACFWGN_20775 [Oerskovia sp. NPDC060338]|uniref:hypothetical protein n=1 Tax=Oerskovia sp. NPDC060338 TaxID=3347100 RepID=UPI0036479752
MTAKPTPPPAPSDAEADDVVALEQLVTEYTKLGAELEHIAERRDTIKAILARRFAPGTTTPVGEHKVQVKSGTRRLNTTRLATAYPVVQHPDLYEPRISTAAVKAHLAPIALAEFYDAGAPTVVIL